MTDRDRLIELIKNAPTTDTVYGDIKLPNPIQTVQTIADHILANCVIVQEQGEWIVSEYPSHLDVKCSVCGGSFYVHNKGQYRIEQSNYCPNCGAKMDGRKWPKCPING